MRHLTLNTNIALCNNRRKAIFVVKIVHVVDYTQYIKIFVMDGIDKDMFKIKKLCLSHFTERDLVKWDSWSVRQV